MKAFFFLLILSKTCVFAQNDSLLEKCGSRNSILFPENLNHYFDQTGALSSFKIVQIGDSHVQIGAFPKAFAATLDSIDAYNTIEENSFWFPYAYFGGYTPKGFTVSCADAIAERMVNAASENRFTITGYALEIPVSENSRNMVINCVRKGFSKIDLVVGTNEDWTIEADASLITKRKISGNLELVSISSARENDSLVLRLVSSKNAQPLRIYGFREPIASTLQEFHFYGSSGSKFSDFTKNCAYLPDFFELVKPDLFIVSLGTNDSYLPQSRLFFGRRVKTIIRTVRENSAASILFTLPPDTYYGNKAPRSTKKVRKRILKIAERNQCAVWDFATVMGGEKSILAWHALQLTNDDLLHLNSDGYQLQGILLVQAIHAANLAGI